MKKKFTLFLLCGLLCTANLNAQTWQIGYPNAENVTATLQDNTLTISGTGAMMDWNYNSTPWNDVRTSIETLVIITPFSGVSGKVMNFPIPKRAAMIMIVSSLFCSFLG